LKSKGDILDQLLKVALQAAHTAGDLIGRNFQKLQNADIQRKGKNDFVTRIDKEAEAIIGNVITGHFPDHQILAETGSKTSDFLGRKLLVQTSSVLAANKTLYPKILKMISSHFK
jgi:fructose-1,6-bisphosphatase/inositol monophosphatase family enzyme